MRPIFTLFRRTSLKFLVLVALAAVVGVACSTTLSSNDGDRAIPLAGGATTAFNRTSSAYEQPSVGLSQENFDRHGDGDVAFEAVFVTAPADINPGLGPLYNNTSCVGCHIRNGRGLPEAGQLLVRVSAGEESAAAGKTAVQLVADGGAGSFYHPEGVNQLENAIPVPGLGTQIQDRGVYGQDPEADVKILWQEEGAAYADGTPYRLRSPVAQITLPNGETLPEDVKTSLRLPPPVFGLGLLEAIPEADLLALADPEDKDGDGISGRPNQVWDMEAQDVAMGRFGLKANQPNLLQQTAAAYVNDMGVTNPLFPEADGASDIDAETLEVATFYAQSLAVPARTLLDDPKVQQGEKLFTEANCAACHISELRTGAYDIAPALANQVIHPYTDLLLHDMGPGLADNRPDFEATGNEWRTPALWGIGLTQTVLPYSSYLHDGRARTLEEAILWHGGEAQDARDAFLAMDEGDRKALKRFLKTL